MAQFPAANYLSNAGRTEGEMKTAFEDWLAATKQISGSGAPETTLVISGGVITPTSGIHSVDTEGATATDDLTNIAQTNLPDGSTLLLRAASGSRATTVKYAAGGTGQILTIDSADVLLRSASTWLMLKRTGTLWQEVSRAGFAQPQAPARLDYASPTLLILQAGRIPLWMTDHWTERVVPAAGVSVTNAGLAVSTGYYVYALPNVSVIALELSVTPPAMSEGVPTKTADGSRILVGAVLTNASSQFVSSGTQRYVTSYYGRRPSTVSNFTASGSTGSTTSVALSTGISFIKWEDEVARAEAQGYSSNAVAGQLTSTDLAINSAVVVGVNAHSATAGATVPFHLGYPVFPTAGALTFAFKAIQVQGKVSANTGSWFGMRESAYFNA